MSNDDYEVTEYNPDTGVEEYVNEDQREVDPIVELLANDLIAFAMAVHEDYVPGPHHYLLANELTRLLTGETKRLIVMMPPQHGKSKLATEIFPAFYFGRKPKDSLIVGGYAQEKADDFGRATKGYMDSEVYRAIFPQVEVSVKSDSIRRFETTAGGKYFAAGVGGPVTGRGANGLIFDDPYKNRKEADSDVITQNIIDWWTSTFRTRLRGDGFICVIQTRWNKRDLIQYLLDNEANNPNPKYKWRILKLKAVIEDEKDAKEDPLNRQVGKSLWPEVFDSEVMEQVKIDVGSRDWNALYQQEPSDVQGEVFLRKNWNYWCTKSCNADHDHHPLPVKFDKKMQMWDCSFKDLKTSNYVVGLVGYKSGPNLYIIDHQRKQATAKATCDMIRPWLLKYPDVHSVGIEDKANGSEVISTMRQEISGIKEVPANDSKHSRASAAAVHQESGNCYLPYDAVWKDDFIEELAAFPHGKYDDRVDAFSHLVLQTLGNRLSGILEWMQEQVNSLKKSRAA